MKSGILAYCFASWACSSSHWNFYKSFYTFQQMYVSQIRIQNCVPLQEKLLLNVFNRILPFKKTTRPVLCWCCHCCSYSKVVCSPLTMPIGTIQKSACTTVQILKLLLKINLFPCGFWVRSRSGFLQFILSKIIKHTLKSWSLFLQLNI